MKTLKQILNEGVLDLVKIVAYSGFISPNENVIPISIYVTFREVNIVDFNELVKTVETASKELKMEFEKEGMKTINQQGVVVKCSGNVVRIGKRLKFKDTQNSFHSLRKKFKIQYAKD